MILSFHPNIVAERNIICAGRLPNDEDRAAICQAQAVILSQGCSEALYSMCRQHCPHVFPNYDVRFDYPGKVGQAGLFQKLGVPFPQTHTFDQLSSYHKLHGPKGHPSPLGLPCVFKFDWGGEGEGVFLLKTDADLAESLKKAQQAQQEGLRGFLLQEYVPCGAQSLRVVMIGDKLVSYWRRQENDAAFFTNLKAGAFIDHGSEPGLQVAGKALVKDFCSKTGINLAAFDLLFADTEQGPNPLFLEINYFFGRQGLGGSLNYYKMVDEAVARWLNNIGLCL